MITITEAARKHIDAMLKSKSAGAALRLFIKKTGCSGYQYIPEIVFQKKESDIAMIIAGLTVYFDADTADLMKGTLVDYVQKSLGVSQLVFTHPDAESVCGCGESFKIKA